MALKTGTMKIRIVVAERERWEVAAERDGRTFSEWVRWVLNREVEGEPVRLGKIEPGGGE